MKNIVFFVFFCVVSTGVSQQTEYVDFKTAKANIVFGDLKENEVKGFVTYSFNVLKDVDSIFIDGKHMKFSNVALNELMQYVDTNHFNVNYKNDSNAFIVYNTFKKGECYELKFNYSVSPKKAIYFIDWNVEDGSKQVWTQGQGKYTSNWMPSIDDMNDKIEFDLAIAFNKDYEVVANGNLVKKEESKKANIWYYDMQKPMSSYLLAMAIGKYNKKVEYSNTGIPLEMYYYPEDSLKVEPTYRYTKRIFDFLEEEIGVPYPWQNYKQVPVKDFLYAGMENTSATIFSDTFVVDSIAFVDKNYVNVNAHELAHQWFGDLVTETSGTHHWLQEGFATYYALLAEREVFGEDYYYWRLYEYTKELLEQDKAGGSTSLLDPKSSSITFYKKGAWVLHVLREKVGDKVFKEGVKNYLLKYQFKNVKTDDFIKEMQITSGFDLSDFVEKWLKNDKFQNEECLMFLKNDSEEVNELIQLNEELIFSSDSLKISANHYFEKAKSLRVKSYFLSKEVIKYLNHNSISEVLSSKDIKHRQAIAQSVSKIPLELKEDYETLLDDKSYATIEAALFGLWNNFPKEQNTYLKKTKGVIGFNDKNIRTLWLTLALISDDFEPENSEIYFKELESYTSSKFSFEIRQNAFSYLTWISSCENECKENLEQASKHHNWRFSKFAKELLKVKSKI